MRMKTTDTRNGMPRPPGAGEHYNDYVVGRQMRRALMRMAIKQRAQHKKLLDRTEAHKLMLSRRRLRRVAQEARQREAYLAAVH